MTAFLKPERRENLIHELYDNLGMPKFAAELIANYNDNLEFIDERMADHTNSSREWVEQMVTAKDEGNQEALDMFAKYVLAETIIIAAYKDEGIERNLKGCFPRWLEAARVACKGSIPRQKRT